MVLQNMHNMLRYMHNMHDMQNMQNMQNMTCLSWALVLLQHRNKRTLVDAVCDTGGPEAELLNKQHGDPNEFVGRIKQRIERIRPVMFEDHICQQSIQKKWKEKKDVQHVHLLQGGLELMMVGCPRLRCQNSRTLE